MYSLMIVEDELLARLALKNSIEWEKYNIEEIMEARDGIEALEKFKEKQPDILIVDINIPIKNGMEVIKEIRKENARTKIIILSCLTDFEYAKAAIKEGVSQYILKASMSMEEMEAAIKTVVEELNHTAKVLPHRDKQNKEEYQQRSVLLRRLLFGEAAKSEKERKLMQYRYLLAVFRVEYITNKEDDLSQELLNKMNFVKNIISSTIQVEYPCQVTILPEGYYVAWLDWREKNDSIQLEQLKQILENAAHLIQKYTSAKIVAAVSDIEKGQETVYHSFQLALKRLQYHIVDESLLFMGNEELFFEKLHKQWAEYLEEAENEMKYFGLLYLFQDKSQWPPFSKEYLTDIQNYWIEKMNRIAIYWENQGYGSISEIVSGFSREVRSECTLKECAELFFWFLNRIKQDKKKQLIYSAVVQKAVKFAEENYDKPITLADAANSIPVSPNYLSVAFGKECGMNFTDYIIQMRLNKAKILLQTTNWKLFEIAEKCGFNDHTYFTKTFRKHENISPYDYRKNSRENSQ